MKAYKTELNPNNKQASFLAQCCGASRYVYNWGLAEWKRQYEAGEKPSSYSLRKQFNATKDDLCPWIRDLPYAVVESSFANLNLAFQNFFMRVKKGSDKAGYPKFKKRGIKNSFQLRNTKVETDRVRLTGIGLVRLKERNYIPPGAEYGIYSTISERAGRWFISVLVKNDDDEQDYDLSGVIGVDLGLKSLAVLSNGKVFDNPKAFRKYERKLSRLQRELSRRKKGSSNRNKTKKKIGRLHYKISSVRTHAIHQVSDYVTKKARPNTIVLENLNVKGMLQNHNLAKSISDASFTELRRQIEYKANRLGIEVIVADRFFASSKTCSQCGNRKLDLPLSVRVYRCDQCGLVLDRDLNAAINLAALAEGQNVPGLPVELECCNVLL